MSPQHLASRLNDLLSKEEMVALWETLVDDCNRVVYEVWRLTKGELESIYGDGPTTIIDSNDGEKSNLTNAPNNG